jgi:hypothetical protein
MNVFISYRRSDTQDLAGRIADRLRAVSQVTRVFIDVDEIAPGVDFVRELESALIESDVCLLLIGPNWHGPRDGSARIFDENDFVRLEVERALAMERKVLPVLANGAAMPAIEQLPETLRPLARINALSIRHQYFDHDLALLFDSVLQRKKPSSFRMYLRRHPVQAGVLRSFAGMFAALVLLFAGAVVHRAATGLALDESLGGPAEVWLLLIVTLSLGLGAAWINPLRRRG